MTGTPDPERSGLAWPNSPKPTRLGNWDEFFETFNVALVVGGSITIPHLRRAVNTQDEVEQL